MLKSDFFGVKQCLNDTPMRKLGLELFHPSNLVIHPFFTWMDKFKPE
jgi:hypothetical protein